MTSAHRLTGLAWLLLCVLVVTWFAVVSPRLSLKECFEWDAAQFGMATYEYSIAKHQPHPPGYWLYVQLLKPAAAATLNPLSAISGLSLLMTLISIWLIGRWRGLPAAIALAFSPIVLLLAPSQTNYAAELVISIVAGWLTARVIEGETHILPWLFGWTGLLSGLRPNTLVYCAPLLLLALFFSRSQWRRYWWRAALAAIVMVLFWFIPQVLNVGSLSAYLSLTQAQFRSNARLTSMLYGASIMGQLETSINCLFWLGFGTGPMLLMWMLSRGAHKPTEPWLRWWFFAAWTLPAFIQTSLVHCPKPGYVAFLLPPAAVLVSRALSVRMSAVAAALSLLLAFGSTQVLQIPRLPVYISRLVKRSVPAFHFEVEQTHQRLRRALSAIPPGTLGIVATGKVEGISHRTLRWSHPQIQWQLWQEFKPDGKEPFIVITGPGEPWPHHIVRLLASDPDFTLYATPGVSLQQTKQ